MKKKIVRKNWLIFRLKGVISLMEEIRKTYGMCYDTNSGINTCTTIIANLKEMK